MLKNTNKKIYPTLLDIADRFHAILLDAYGVFWGGNSLGVLSGAKEAMEALVSSGKVVGILSNSTQLSVKELDKLRAHDLLEGTHFHFLVTSGEVAKQIFRNEELPFPTLKKKYCLFCSANPKFSSHRMIFQGTPYSETSEVEEADFIYVPVPNINGKDQTNPEIFRAGIKTFIKSGLPMVCANPDRFAHEGNPPKAVVRQGSIAAMYEELGGKVFYIGKPSDRAFNRAMEQFTKRQVRELSEILMVGDTPETDIRGARQFGIATALVTQTGIMADRISKNGLEAVVKGFPASDCPDYYIERLGHHDI